MTEEERKAQRLAAGRERMNRWRLANPKRVKEYNRQYVEQNRDREKERRRRWRMGKIGAIDPCAPQATESAVAHRFQLFNNACAYCGGDGRLHLDHVVPLSRGGMHTPGNLVPACERCNHSKRAQPVEAWYLSQPFFDPERWAMLRKHTGQAWSAAVQLSLLGPTPPESPNPQVPAAPSPPP